jgi:hypothetical protein
VTAWWCEYDGEAHESASECSLYRNGTMGPTGLTPKQTKDYKRRAMMHAKNPPKSSGCAVIGVALVGVAAAIVVATVYGAHEVAAALLP